MNSSLTLSIVALGILCGCAIPSNAEVLVYFDENGGNGNPRGLYNFDTATGASALRVAVQPGPRFFAMAVRPSDGVVFAADAGTVRGNFLHTLNIDTGAWQQIAAWGDLSITNLAFDPAGQLFALDRNSRALYRVDTANGTLTTVGNTQRARAGFTFDSHGNLFGLTSGTSPINNAGILYRIDPTSAADTLVGGTTDLLLLEDAVATTDGMLYVTEYNGSIYRYDMANGDRTLVAATAMGDGLLSLIQIPEPSSVPVIVVAIAFGLRRPRRGGLSATWT